MTKSPNENDQLNNKEVQALLSQYNITCVPVNYYHVGQYRYTSLEEAVAQAKRQSPDRSHQSEALFD